MSDIEAQDSGRKPGPFRVQLLRNNKARTPSAVLRNADKTRKPTAMTREPVDNHFDRKYRFDPNERTSNRTAGKPGSIPKQIASDQKVAGTSESSSEIPPTRPRSSGEQNSGSLPANSQAKLGDSAAGFSRST